MAAADLHAEDALLTTHVLDLLKGGPAPEIGIKLYRRDDETTHLVRDVKTNWQGRCEAPLMVVSDFAAGSYLLRFDVSTYFAHPSCFPAAEIEFSMPDRTGHYHVPLVLAPGGYSTYRGAPPSRRPDDNGTWDWDSGDAGPKAGAARPPGVGGAGLTIHAIDIAQGRGAGLLEVELYQDEPWSAEPINAAVINSEGRTNEWLVEAGQLIAGDYWLVFKTGSYYTKAGFPVGPAPFFERVRVRLQIHNPSEHHHIPLLLSPWGYSCYRGS